MTAGVYVFLRTKPPHVRYVGCSSHMEARWARHRSALVQNQHPNFRLQQAYNQDPEHWKFIILETTDPDHKYIREQVWIDRMMRHFELLNLDLIPDEHNINATVSQPYGT